MSELQQRFLSELKQKQALTAIYLKNGIKLKGRIAGFDEDVIYIQEPSPQIIYIKNISTIAELLF